MAGATLLGFGLAQFAQLTMALVPVFLLVSAGARAIKGYRPAQIYILALLLPMISGFLMILGLLGVFATPDWLRAAYEITTTLAILLFAIGLADRINLLNSEKQAAEARAAVADNRTRVKSAFLARMSHEIRTPMNGVLGMSQLLGETRLTETQRQYNEVIHSSGTTLLHIIDELLDYSKLEAGKMTFENTAFEPATVVNEVAGMFLPRVTETGVPLRTSIDPEVPAWLTGDPTRISQILTNLIGNAFKFTERGEIRLTITTEGDATVFTVRDTGIGIEPDRLPMLFQSYRQATLTTTREYGGTGLGLAICRQFAELMGGSVMASSLPGEGSVFTVRLPLATADAPDERSWGRRATDRVDSPLRILVAEDNRVNQMVIRGMLQRQGHSVAIAGDGSAACIRAGEESFDLIFMDCEMPVLDGFDATRRLRSIEALQETPIIALTAHVTQEWVDRCLDAGMDAHIAKPVQAETIAEVIGEVVGARREAPQKPHRATATS